MEAMTVEEWGFDVVNHGGGQFRQLDGGRPRWRWQCPGFPTPSFSLGQDCDLPETAVGGASGSLDIFSHRPQLQSFPVLDHVGGVVWD